MKKRFYTVILAFLITSQVFLPMAIPATMGIQIDMLLSQVRTNAGGSLSGGRVYFYAAGTSTPKDVYLDINKNTAAANPYTLDSNGTAYLFGDGLYRIVIKTAAGVTAYDRDNIRYEDFTSSVTGVADNTTFHRGDGTWFKLPRYFSPDAFSDNLTLYADDAILKGPWVDVRAFLPTGYVTDGSVDYSTQVQAALDNLANGSTLLVPITIGVGGASGWTGIHITGKSNISVIGISGGGFKVLALPHIDDVLQEVCTSCGFPAFKVSNSERITISGLDFNSNSISGYLAPTTVIPTLLYFDNVSNSRVTGNKFYGAIEAFFANVQSVRSSNNEFSRNEFTGGAIGLSPGLGFDGWYDNNITISGNVFHDITHSAIQASFMYSAITGNIFKNPNSAINLGPSSHDIAMTGNTFSNCAFAWRNDIYDASRPAYGINFSSNVIDNCVSGITPAKTRDSIVSNNYMLVGSYGLFTDSLEGVIISGNRVIGINDNGIRGIGTYGNSSNITISGNRISGFGQGSGIHINNVTEPSVGYTIVSDNFSSKNDFGLYLYSGDNVIVTGNVFYNNVTADFRKGVVQAFGFNNRYIDDPVYLTGPPLKYFVGTKAFSYGSAAPTDNTIACATGDIVWNTGTDNVLGWKCTTAGSPGTWGAMTVTMP